MERSKIDDGNIPLFVTNMKFFRQRAKEVSDMSRGPVRDKERNALIKTFISLMEARQASLTFDPCLEEGKQSLIIQYTDWHLSKNDPVVTNAVDSVMVTLDINAGHFNGSGVLVNHAKNARHISQATDTTQVNKFNLLALFPGAFAINGAKLLQDFADAHAPYVKYDSELEEILMHFSAGKTYYDLRVTSEPSQPQELFFYGRVFFCNLMVTSFMKPSIEEVLQEISNFIETDKEQR